MDAIRLAEANLPEAVKTVLQGFLEAAREACGAALESAVLFGSAAEGQLRATSDVNLILVLSEFNAAAVASHLEQPLRFAETGIRLKVMFLLHSELAAAAEAFAQKFHDISTRRLVLFGADPFAALAVPPEAHRRQVEQVLLNLSIRLREQMARNWSRKDLLGRALADAVGPLRGCAHSMLALSGRPAASPKAALEALLAEPGAASYNHLAQYYSRLREQAAEPGSASKALRETAELIAWMRRRNA